MSMAERTWRKSSYSGSGNGDCVEVAFGEAVGLRDSKHTEPVLEFPMEQWRQFLQREWA
ncbi:MAG TPA: DUF397 domain-containing protein [Pseudonocardiaceae bacterium]|nr:DUF397 domain-containing protein [Pseudonocardiaceae bacterium]